MEENLFLTKNCKNQEYLGKTEKDKKNKSHEHQK